MKLYVDSLEVASLLILLLTICCFQGQMHQGNSYLTVRSFLNGDVSGGYSTQAARAKATALFYRADEVVSNWDPRTCTSLFVSFLLTDQR